MTCWYFYSEELLALRLKPKLEDDPLSNVRDKSVQSPLFTICVGRLPHPQPEHATLRGDRGLWMWATRHTCSNVSPVGRMWQVFTKSWVSTSVYILFPTSAVVFILLSVPVHYLLPTSSWTPVLLREIQAETLDPILKLIKALHVLASYLPVMYSYIYGYFFSLRFLWYFRVQLFPMRTTCPGRHFTTIMISHKVCLRNVWVRK